MSRSKKKTPVFKSASTSSKKKDKELANRIFRHKEKQALKDTLKNEDIILFERVAEVSNVYDWNCDGWSYVNDWEKKEWLNLRK